MTVLADSIFDPLPIVIFDPVIVISPVLPKKPKLVGSPVTKVEPIVVAVEGKDPLPKFRLLAVLI